MKNLTNNNINLTNVANDIKEVPYFLELTDDTQPHFSSGNNKIGPMLNGSTLPGDANHMVAAKGKTLTNVPGTCSGNCEYCFDRCYARQSAMQHHNVVIKAWGENTLLIRNRPQQWFKALDNEITKRNKKKKKVVFYRHNVSGEFTKLIEIELLNEVATHHPDVIFSVYSKNYDLLDQFFTKHGDSADNFVINVSQWHHCADEFLKKWRGKVNVFEYDDSNRKWCTMSDEDKARVAKITHCPAIDANGNHVVKPNGDPVTCFGCRRCYTKANWETCVNDH